MDLPLQCIMYRIVKLQTKIWNFNLLSETLRSYPHILYRNSILIAMVLLYFLHLSSLLETFICFEDIVSSN